MDVLSYWLSEIANSNASPASEQAWEFIAPVDRERLKVLIRRIEIVRAIKVSGKWNGKTNSTRKGNLLGHLLEEIGKVLFKSGSALAYLQRVNTTTSEIDFLMVLDALSVTVPCLRSAGTHVIGEAKCHDSAPKSEWANKLAGVMNTNGCSLAILLVACPPRKLPSAIRVTLVLQASTGFNIVPFGRTQLDQVIAGASVFGVLSRQYVLMKNHAAALAV